MTIQRVLEYPGTTENVMGLMEQAVFEGRNNFYLSKGDDTALLGEVFLTKVIGDGRLVIRLLDETEYTFSLLRFFFGIRVDDNGSVVATTIRNNEEYYYLSAG